MQRNHRRTASTSKPRRTACNSMTMQIYADVTGRTIDVVDTDQASALGVAMLGAIAGSVHETLLDAVSAMAPTPARTYAPQSDHVAVYDALYEEYCRLRDHFGRGGHDVMHTLGQLRSEQANAYHAGPRFIIRELTFSPPPVPAGGMDAE